MSLSSGRRCHDDERQLVAELGRYMHLARTDRRQDRIARKAIKHVDPQPPSDADAAGGDSPQLTGAQRPRRVRKSTAARSVWVSFKGAASRLLPKTSPGHGRRTAQFRQARGIQTRIAAVSTAEAYFESALTQARDAGLDEAATEEYLAEQQAAAAKLLRRAPLGQYMHSLARTVGLGHRLDAEPGVPDNAEHRQALAQCIVRERMLVGDAADDAMPDPLTEADAYLAKAAMRLTHLEKKVTHDGGVLLDVVPTQCIVRIKNSGRRKQTAFVTSQKAAVSFKTNFAAFLKKDVAPLLKYFKDDAVSDDKKAKKNNATPPPKSGGAGGKKK